MSAKLYEASVIRSSSSDGKHHYDFFVTAQGDMTIMHVNVKDSTMTPMQVSPPTLRFIYEHLKELYGDAKETPDDR